MEDIKDMAQAQRIITQLRGELAHWKANHADMVGRCTLLASRDDLPVDRIPAFLEMKRLQERVRELEGVKAKLAEVQGWYDDAMAATNEAGYACMDAASVIRAMHDEAHINGVVSARMVVLLNGVANALHGARKEGGAWSLHDLPELAQSKMIEIARYEAEREDAARALARHSAKFDQMLERTRQEASQKKVAQVTAKRWHNLAAPEQSTQGTPQ